MDVFADRNVTGVGIVNSAPEAIRVSTRRLEQSVKKEGDARVSACRSREEAEVLVAYSDIKSRWLKKRRNGLTRSLYT